MKSKKKSQISGEVFVYILGIVIVGGIIAYGYYAVTSLKNRAEEISYLEFKNNLESTVKSSATYGNTKIEDFILPDKVNEVCFVELEYTTQLTELNICKSSSSDYKPLVCNSWIDKTKANVFLEPLAQFFLVSKIAVDGNEDGNEDKGDYTGCGRNCHYLCLKANANHLKIRLDGKGPYTFIRKP